MKSNELNICTLTTSVLNVVGESLAGAITTTDSSTENCKIFQW